MRGGAALRQGGALASGDEGGLLTLDARQTRRDSGIAKFDVMALTGLDGQAASGNKTKCLLPRRMAQPLDWRMWG